MSDSLLIQEITDLRARLAASEALVQRIAREADIVVFADGAILNLEKRKREEAERAIEKLRELVRVGAVYLESAMKHGPQPGTPWDYGARDMVVTMKTALALLPTPEKKSQEKP